MMSTSYRAGQRTAFALLAVLAVVGAVLFVSTSRSNTAACGAPFAEPIDPLSSQHVLPGAPTPHYATDPPTSGAHQPGTYPTGVLSKPIAPIVQVSLLEEGEVLMQYQGVNASTLHKLRGVAKETSHVTVAPNSSLTSNIVATAWLWKMNCRSFDEKALLAFVKAHQPTPQVFS